MYNPINDFTARKSKISTLYSFKTETSVHVRVPGRCTLIIQDTLNMINPTLATRESYKRVLNENT